MGIDMKSELNNVYLEKIEQMIQGVIQVLDSESKGIILYGSAASNNLTYRIIEGKYEFFSDIEILIIPYLSENAYKKSYRQSLNQKIIDYFCTLDYLIRPPVIDVYPVTLEYFSNMNFRISAYELKETGKVLKGDNYLLDIPNVNKNNYEYKVQNIEIVKALKLLLIEGNKYFFHLDYHTNETREKFCYFLYSSFLNILRTLLPMFDFFEYSLSKRLELVSKLQNDQRVNQYFDVSVFKDFITIGEKKGKCDFTVDITKFYIHTIETYKKLICMQLNCNETSLNDSIETKKNQYFYGNEKKVTHLSLLMNFFVSALDCFIILLRKEKLTDENINKAKYYLDKLIFDEKSYDLLNLIDKYVYMESSRWKIIGSKD